MNDCAILGAMKLSQFDAMALVVPLLLGFPPAAANAGEEVVVGPALGHVDETTARVWIRPPQPGDFELVVRGVAGEIVATAEGRALVENDLCVVFEAVGLSPDSDHTYEIRGEDGPLADGPTLRFRTAPGANSPGRARLAFGSCASSEPSSVWSAIELRGAEGLVLLGDTPYLDTRDLAEARARHRGFLQVPELARLVRSTPIWGTWDDHDFGGNDVDGRMEGKERTRQAFVEYRAHAHFGEHGEGIYTSFRRGPIEVFLLDARWFARTAKDAEERWTLLGERQWRWLEARLTASTASFKILATGMIWDDKENSESDDWGAFPHERERIERFIGENDISGVVLMGGDIHCSRHLSYPGSAERAGYAIDQLIVSPLHEGTIASLNVPHPDLVWSAVEPRVFLMLEAETLGDEPELSARWIQDTGVGAGRVLHEARWTEAGLSR